MWAALNCSHKLRLHNSASWGGSIFSVISAEVGLILGPESACEEALNGSVGQQIPTLKAEVAEKLSADFDTADDRYFFTSSE